MQHALVHLLLARRVLCVPQAFALQTVGHVLLRYEVARIVVGVFVAVVVAEVGHQFRRRVAQVQRHGTVAGALDEGQGLGYPVVGRVALRARGKVDGGFGQRYAPLGPAYLAYGVEGGVGQQQGVGVGQAYVLCRAYHEPARYELRVLAPFYHARQPVEGCVGVGAAYALDEG